MDPFDKSLDFTIYKSDIENEFKIYLNNLSNSFLTIILKNLI